MPVQAGQRADREDQAIYRRVEDAFDEQGPALVTLAQEENGSRPPRFTEVKLRADERVHTTVPAGLVELRKTDGQFRRQVV